MLRPLLATISTASLHNSIHRPICLPTGHSECPEMCGFTLTFESQPSILLRTHFLLVPFIGPKLFCNGWGSWNKITVYNLFQQEFIPLGSMALLDALKVRKSFRLSQQQWYYFFVSYSLGYCNKSNHSKLFFQSATPLSKHSNDMLDVAILSFNLFLFMGTTVNPNSRV